MGYRNKITLMIGDSLTPDNEKYYDSIPSLLEKKYLKTIYKCHDCAGTLTGGDIDGDGKITVLDLDYVIH
ncbi:MAG: hypothetical protein M1495_22440 [Bacteroidetes bacterium]|nr:hypothetical protein [Bacteroidota bacterium]MCL6097325.1 hypothetical protein [Bacteroidota bacterium]